MIDQKETLGDKFIKKGMWLYIFSFLAGPLGYIVKIMLSNDLSVKEVGIIYAIVSLVMLLISYHDLGLTESLNFFLPKFIVENDYSKFKSVLAYALFAQIPTSIIIGLGLFFGAEFLSINYFHAKEALGPLRIFCLFFVLMNLFQIVNTVYLASQNTKYQKGTELVRMLAIALSTFVFFIFGKGTITNYSWTWNIGLVFGIVFSYILFYNKYYKVYLRSVKVVYDKVLFKKVFSYALWVLLAMNVGTILGQIDMQLILYMKGPEAAGYYTNYQSIIGIPFLLISPIIGFLFPVISELNGKANNEKIKFIKTMFYKYFGVIGIITSVIMFVYAKDLAVMFFGEKFSRSGVILQYSIFFLIFNFLMQINFQVLAGVGRIKERVKILAIGLLFNVPLNIILISFLSVEGSSLAVGLSWIPIFLMSHYVTREYNSGFDYRFFFKNLIFALGLGLLLHFLKNILPMPPSRINMLIYILIFSILYILAFVLINLKEGRLFFGELKRIRKNKI